MTTPRWLDLLLAAYIVWGVIGGLRRGFVLQIMSLAGYVAGILVAARWGAVLTHTVLAVVPVRSWVIALLPPHLPAASPLYGQALGWAQGLTGVLVFLLLVGVAEAAGRTVGVALTRILHQARITGTLNSLGGGVAGLVEHGLLAGLLLTLVLTAPLVHGSAVAHAIHQAPLASELVRWFGHVAHLPGVWAL